MSRKSHADRCLSRRTTLRSWPGLVAGCASVEFVSFRAGARSGFTENGAQCGGLRVAAYTHAVWSATTVRDRCVVRGA